MGRMDDGRRQRLIGTATGSWVGSGRRRPLPRRRREPTDDGIIPPRRTRHHEKTAAAGAVEAPAAAEYSSRSALNESVIPAPLRRLLLVFVRRLLRVILPGFLAALEVVDDVRLRLALVAQRRVLVARRQAAARHRLEQLLRV